ncbi:MAG: hypothetical protein COU40_01750 [Candidatus Moranbacteria bacterium CG10_big_fil_rev_8_21_14_0_10_35_21]|nr:MAG: hypothetical protein COU40_01750 [Candidatus Moranbacteria bacterium CG10_big_fil_rev_8_21_14_0_10_35_21]PJA88973.1 MAG: hypothetical protein CO139_00320 [Candidatus Moranbacteria bacterium CG_4_9_14_3_um_filter_36_9]
MEENTNKKTIEEMMTENLQLTQEIHKMTKSVKNYVIVQRILSVVYLLLIVVPLILSIIYLPPLLGNVIGQYQNLLGGEQNVGDMKNPQNMGNILDQAQKLLNENNK